MSNGPDEFPNTRATYNSLAQLDLGNVPKGIDDPKVYKELLRIHDAIEQLAASLMQLGDGQKFQHPHWLANLQDVTLTDPIDPKHFLGYDQPSEMWVNKEQLYQFAEAWPTGLVNGGELNIGPGVNDVEALTGLGIVVNSYTNPMQKPTYLGLEWEQINTAITAPAVAGSLVWMSIVDSGTPSTPPTNGDIPIVPINIGQLEQSTTRPTPLESRQKLFLGVVVHNGSVWKEVSNPKVVNQAAETLREVLTDVLPLTHIIEGGQVTETGTFSVAQAAGTLWEQNRNWHVDKANPNREALAAASPVSFKYINADFSSTGSATPTFDPTRYTPYPGTAAPVAVGGGASQATIQKLYLDPAGNYWVLWGQYSYATFFEAEANIRTDLAKSNIPFILRYSLLLGFVVMEKGKTNWDVNEAVFIPVNWITG